MAKSKAKGTRRNPTLPTSLQRINLNAAGIDAGGASHYVAVPEDRDAQPVREFAAFTGDLYRMAQWLKACGIDTVVIRLRAALKIKSPGLGCLG